jgi:hypothetical protein
VNSLNADRVVRERPAPTKTDWLARAKSLPGILKHYRHTDVAANKGG